MQSIRYIFNSQGTTVQNRQTPLTSFTDPKVLAQGLIMTWVKLPRVVSWEVLGWD